MIELDADLFCGIKRTFNVTYENEDIVIDILFRPNLESYENELDYQVLEITGIHPTKHAEFYESDEFKQILKKLEEPITPEDFKDTTVWLYESTVDVVDCRVVLICVVMKFDVTKNVLNPYSYQVDTVSILEQEYLGQEPNGYKPIPKDDPIVDKITAMVLSGYYDYEIKFKALKLF